jgi:L-alanine-DL-glutamate epimerase-like enolase superfamily enzyme
MRIRDIAVETENFRYRTPIKFGGVALDRVTILNVTLTVEHGGHTSTGFGSMPVGNVWAWPSRTLDYDGTLAAMLGAAEHIRDCYSRCTLDAHPVEIGHALESDFFQQSAKLPEPIPKLAVLVVASPFDAALHDAFGKLHGLNCFRTYGPEFLKPDLGEFLGAEFRGETLDRFVSPVAVPSLPLYHLVGALDPLAAADVSAPVGDGLPETLLEWCRRDGLTHLKIKLNGDDLGWDVERCVRVNAVAEECDPSRPWQYSLDFNERCRDVAYLLEFLRQLEVRTPRGFERVQYVEQPTARDLKANPGNRMHAAAAIRPVVIDESLIDLETLHLAREQGYTGVAFKACKGQTQTLLLAAAAQKLGLFRCVQDLTCVGASLIHSASIAAHIPGVAAIESNGRQYCPAANAEWDARFPGAFTIRDGIMNTAVLDGPGLGAV